MIDARPSIYEHDRALRVRQAAQRCAQDPAACSRVIETVLRRTENAAILQQLRERAVHRARMTR